MTDVRIYEGSKMTPPQPQVYAALSAVQKDLAAIGIAKNSNNSAQSFKFRGIDAMYNALAPILGRHGVVIVPDNVVYERTTLTNAKGNPSYQTLASVSYKFYAKDGSYISGFGVGEAQDTGDKSMSKALTMAYKYFIIHSLTIPLEGDVDPDGEIHESASYLTPAQAQELELLIAETNTDMNVVLKAYTVKGNPTITSLMEIPATAFEAAKKRLIAKKTSGSN